MTRRVKVRNDKVCGGCSRCTPYMEFHTLNIRGEPTMGTCPEWKESKCVLLSQPACEKYV